jgi:hypothetical protein
MKNAFKLMVDSGLVLAVSMFVSAGAVTAFSLSLSAISQL